MARERERDNNSRKADTGSTSRTERGFFDNLRLPPKNEDAERALLGSLMLNVEAIYDIADILQADAFYNDKHQQIYAAMLELHTQGTPIDVVTVSNRLNENQLLESAGGRAYLSELVNSAVSPGSAKHYANIIQSKSLLRRLTHVGFKVSSLGYDEAREVSEVIEEAEKALFEVAGNAAVRRFLAIKDELTQAWERMETLQKQSGALRGVASGYPALDNMLSGFQESDLIILAARPSMGKTALALDIARQTATKHKNAVGIFSLEMSSQQLTDRMLAAQAGVNSWKLRTGRISKDDEYERLRNAIGELSDAPIYIDDQPAASVLSVRSVARRMKIEHDLKLIIVDYLQLLAPSSTRYVDNVVQQVTEISRGLKGMARELKVPVIALSQLSRAVEQRGGRPRLSDLRDSGSIEQDADVVMFIHREDMQGNRSSNEKTGVAEILIEKHRNGPVGKVDLMFDDEKTTFRSVDKNDWGDIQNEAKVEGDETPF